MSSETPVLYRGRTVSKGSRSWLVTLPKPLTVRDTPCTPPRSRCHRRPGPRLAEPSYAGWLTVWNQSAKLNPGCPSLRLLHSSVFINIERRVHVPEREREREKERERVIDEESDTAHRCLCVPDREGETFIHPLREYECHITGRVSVTRRALTRSVFQIWNTAMESFPVEFKYVGRRNNKSHHNTKSPYLTQTWWCNKYVGSYTNALTHSALGTSPNTTSVLAIYTNPPTT